MEKYILDRQHGAMSRFGALSVQHNGVPGAVLARAMAMDRSEGYSLPVQFLNPAAAKSNNIQGAGLRVAPVKGEQLSAFVVMHNASQTAMTVNGRVPYTLNDGSSGAMYIPELELSSRETKVVDITDLLNLQGVRHNDIASAGLELQHTGDLGSLITSAFAASKSGNQVFRVPLWDVAAQRSATGGYPWYIEGDSSTLVYIKNVTDRPRQFRMYVMFDGGTYLYPLTTVAASETTTIDIRALRDNQFPDMNGNTIPLTATHGQVQWSMTGGEDKVLIGRSEQVDLTKGISSNYACINCCGNSFYDAWLTPGQGEAFEGEEIQFIAMQQDANCYGYPFAPHQVGASFSGNPSICDPNSSGLATATGPGSTGILGQWGADEWISWGNDQCQYSPVDVLRDALCSVVVPTYLTVSSVSTLPTGTSGDFGCSPAEDYGIRVAIRFQVRDQYGAPIRRSDMIPQETLTDFVVNGTPGPSAPDFRNVGPTHVSGTSQFTDANGTFLDAPVGGCFNFSNTYSIRQQLFILVNGHRWIVRINEMSGSSSSAGHGSISNGSDIQKSR